MLFRRGWVDSIYRCPSVYLVLPNWITSLHPLCKFSLLNRPAFFEICPSQTNLIITLSLEKGWSCNMKEHDSGRHYWIRGGNMVEGQREREGQKSILYNCGKCSKIKNLSPSLLAADDGMLLHKNIIYCSSEQRVYYICMVSELC